MLAVAGSHRVSITYPGSAWCVSNPLATAAGNRAAAAVGRGAWCALAAFLIDRFRARLSQEVIVAIHRWMALLVFALAIYFAVTFFRSL